MTRIFFLLIPTGLFVLQLKADETDSAAFFEKRIRPVLVEHCYECHSASAQAIKGGLRLDTREAIRSGGESGPGVVPGDLELGSVVSAMKYESVEMPPKGKLSESVSADFEKWVADGAIDPRDAESVPPLAAKSAQARAVPARCATPR